MPMLKVIGAIAKILASLCAIITTIYDFIVIIRGEN